MGTAWEWLDDSKTIVLVSMQGNWTQGDLNSYTNDFWPQIEQQSHTVDVIVDLRGGGALPIQPITSLLWVGQHRPANAGRVVFVVRRTSGLALVRALNLTVQRLYPKFKLSGVLTREEAVRSLTSSRAAESTRSPVQADNQSPSESQR
jgi:hypothetical protein